MNGVRQVDEDHLLIKQELFYKYTGLGYRTTHLVDEAARNTAEQSPGEISRHFALQIMYLGAKTRLGPTNGHPTTALPDYGLDQQEMSLDSTKSELAPIKQTLEQRSGKIEVQASNAVKYNRAMASDFIHEASFSKADEQRYNISPQQAANRNKKIKSLAQNLSAALERSTFEMAQLSTELAISRRHAAWLNEKYDKACASIMSKKPGTTETGPAANHCVSRTISALFPRHLQQAQ